MVGLWRYLSRSTVLAFGLQTAQGYAASSISGLNILPPLDSPSPLSPVASNHAQRLMEEKDKQGTEGKEGEKDTPLLQIDPKWCVRRLASPRLTAAEHRTNAASKMLSELSSNLSRMTMLVSISIRCTRGRRPSTMRTTLRSMTKTSTLP